MYKLTLLLLVFAVTAFSAEISSSYALMEKHAMFNPELKTEQVDKEAKKDSVAPEQHPVYRREDYNERRAKIEPVRPLGPVVKHERMLSDQPMEVSTEVNRIDNLPIPGYGYGPVPVEVAYPDIPYAPGYAYDNGYSASNSFDMYGNSPSPYYVEPDTSPFSLLWSQVPDARTLVSYVGRTISWLFGSFFVLFLGSLLTVGVCSYTNICAITFTGVPIHEEMRAIITPERLEKISTAADFVKTAIDKYQKIQTVADEAVKRRRRAILF